MHHDTLRRHQRGVRHLSGHQHRPDTHAGRHQLRRRSGAEPRGCRSDRRSVLVPHQRHARGDPLQRPLPWSSVQRLVRRAPGGHRFPAPDQRHPTRPGVAGAGDPPASDPDPSHRSRRRGRERLRLRAAQRHLLLDRPGSWPVGGRVGVDECRWDLRHRGRRAGAPRRRSRATAASPWCATELRPR